MKRWHEDPEERAAAGLLAPLARHEVPPDARSRIWRAVEQGLQAPPGRARTSSKIGVLVLAIAFAGVATARMMREPDAPGRAEPPAAAPAPRAAEPAALAPIPEPTSTEPAVAPAPRNPGPSGSTESVAAPASPGAAPPASQTASAQPASRGPAQTASAQPAEPSPARAAPMEVAEPAVAPAPSPAAAPAAIEPPPPADPVPADAELAAYKEARAAMRGDLADALARWSAFLAAFPGGRFDVEARISIIECKVRLGRLADAEPDADAFLARHPASERAREVRFVRAEVQRTVHRRCDRALADYREAAASPRVGEDALFFRGWCAGELGDLTERDAALRAYLERAPAGRHAAAARALLERKP